MVRAFIMVKVAAGDAEPLASEVAGLDHILEAHVIAGDFDLIAEAEAEEVADVMGTAATAIRAIEGVIDTKTYICLE